MQHTITPQKIGRYLGTDESGYIIPDVSWDHITGEWKEVIDFLISHLKDYPNISSLYIRGSLPRGLAIKHISDIDLIYFSEEKIEKLEHHLNALLKDQYPFIRGLELIHLNQRQFSTIYPPQKIPYFQMLLKTQALLLWGQDQAKDLAPIRPGIEMISHAFALKNEFKKLPVWINEDVDQLKKNETIKWFFRRLVRSGLEITLNDQKKFTRDLYFCYELFSESFPSKEPIMRLALENSLNAQYEISHFDELVDFIHDEVLKM